MSTQPFYDNYVKNYPLSIYDNGLNLLAIIDDYESGFFERNWYTAGQFEFHRNYWKPYTQYLTRGNLVQFNNDSTKVGIITEVTTQVDDKGKGGQEVVFKGYELPYLWTRRFIYPPGGQVLYVDEADIETVFKDLVSTQAGPTAAAARQIPGLTLATNQHRGPLFLLSTRYTAMDQIMSSMSLASQMGQMIYIDPVNKVLIFDVLQGNNLSAGNAGNVIFSTDFESVQMAQLQDTDVDYKNYVLAAGSGTGLSRVLQPVWLNSAEPSGWDRREWFLDARDLTAVGDLTYRGQQQLKTTSQTNFWTGQLLPKSIFKYGVDFSVGDYVTIQQFGITQNSRIAVVRENVQVLSYSLDVTFDKPYPHFPKNTTKALKDLEATNNINESSAI